MEMGNRKDEGELMDTGFFLVLRNYREFPGCPMVKISCFNC